MIAIIDYDAGNIKSVEKALLALGQEVEVTSDREKILSADKVILPGVGAFGDAMANLRESGLDEVIREVVKKDGEGGFLGDSEEEIAKRRFRGDEIIGGRYDHSGDRRSQRDPFDSFENSGDRVIHYPDENRRFSRLRFQNVRRNGRFLVPYRMEGDRIVRRFEKVGRLNRVDLLFPQRQVGGLGRFERRGDRRVLNVETDGWLHPHTSEKKKPLRPGYHLGFDLPGERRGDQFARAVERRSERRVKSIREFRHLAVPS